MPRFFFDVMNGRSRPDADGLDLPDFDAARAEAVRAAGEMLREMDREFPGEEWRMIVTDEAGIQVLTLEFRATRPAL